MLGKSEPPFYSKLENVMRTIDYIFKIVAFCIVWIAFAVISIKTDIFVIVDGFDLTTVISLFIAVVFICSVVWIYPKNTKN